MLDKLLVKLILQPYWRLTRSQTLGVQGIVVEDGRKVLLVRHSYVRGWHFPGGGVERSENLEQALLRELREECGVVPRGRPSLHGVFANFSRAPGDHIAVFLVRDWHIPAPPKRSLEIVEQRFFELDALPEGVIAGARRRLDEVFNGHPCGCDW